MVDPWASPSRAPRNRSTPSSSLASPSVAWLKGKLCGDPGKARGPPGSRRWALGPAHLGFYSVSASDSSRVFTSSLSTHSPSLAGILVQPNSQGRESEDRGARGPQLRAGLGSLSAVPQTMSPDSQHSEASVCLNIRGNAPLLEPHLRLILEPRGFWAACYSKCLWGCAREGALSGRCPNGPSVGCTDVKWAPGESQLSISALRGVSRLHQEV